MSEILTEGTFCGADLRFFKSFRCGLKWSWLNGWWFSIFFNLSISIPKNAPKNPQITQITFHFFPGNFSEVKSYSIWVSHDHTFAPRISWRFDVKVSVFAAHSWGWEEGKQVVESTWFAAFSASYKWRHELMRPWSWRCENTSTYPGYPGVNPHVSQHLSSIHPSDEISKMSWGDNHHQVRASVNVTLQVRQAIQVRLREMSKCCDTEACEISLPVVDFFSLLSRVHSTSGRESGIVFREHARKQNPEMCKPA